MFLAYKNLVVDVYDSRKVFLPFSLRKMPSQPNQMVFQKSNHDFFQLDTQTLRRELMGIFKFVNWFRTFKENKR